MKALLAQRVFDGKHVLPPQAVLIEDATVIGLVAPDDMPRGIEVMQLNDAALLAPGFVDIQVNGGGGVLFNHRQDVPTLRHIAQAHARLGTTAILPTLFSSDIASRYCAIDAARQAIEERVPGIVGLHLEGPFLSPTRRGIHPARMITTPSDTDMAQICADFPAPMVITLAPEVVEFELIRSLRAAGRIVFAGHSDASCDTAQASFDAGVTGVTHLFNAMSQITPREPGLVGAALLNGYGGIIVDLLHVDPVNIRLAHRLMGPERLFLVSDAMATVGGGATSFDIDGNHIRLHDGMLADANFTLAGAHLSMAGALRNAVKYVGIPLQDALRMATSTPAAAVGLPRHGKIMPGSRADFVELGPDLAVRAVWQNGEVLE